MTNLGYGYFEEVPTYYGFTWLLPELIDSYLKMKTGGAKIPTLLTGGYNSLFSSMVKQDQLKVEFNVEIKEVRRREVGKDSKEAPVEIVVEDKEKKEKKTLEFDFVVVTCAIPEILSVFDATKEEKTIFEALKPVSLVTHLIDANDPDDQKRPGITTFPLGYSIDSQGSPYGIVNSSKAIWQESKKNEESGKISYVTYQLLDHALADGELKKVTEQMTTALTKFGLENIDVVAVRPHTYFYHFNSAAIAKRYPWKILEMQGARNTWWAGASVSFESVNDVVNYNKMLVEKFLHKSSLEGMSTEK